MEALYFALTLQMKVFCFVQMATAARPIEVLRLEWGDIDFIRKEIHINKPAKHGKTRSTPLIGRFTKVLDMLTEWKNRQYNLARQQRQKTTQHQLDLHLQRHRHSRRMLQTCPSKSSKRKRHARNQRHHILQQPALASSP